uniref:Uncharacterized protein n=1 Tax=Timema douglasi TaxID=61478 RepID=A0A7R8ZDK2_TIMDO|nr:unnamed protein product [Timema douglasi]
MWMASSKHYLPKLKTSTQNLDHLISYFVLVISLVHRQTLGHLIKMAS